VSANPAAPSLATPPAAVAPRRAGSAIELARRHPAALALGGFALLALLLNPLFSALPRGGTISIGSAQVPTVALVWLVAALAVSVALVRVRVRVERQLIAGTDALLERTRPPDVSTAPARIREVDIPALGSSMVSGLLSLLTFLIVQSALRRPVVAVVSAWAPVAWVDDAFVVLVVLVSVLMLVSLHRLGSPVILQLAWSGLDAVAPTAGFDSRQAAASAQPRRITRTGSPAAAASAAAPRPLPEGQAATEAPALPAGQTSADNATAVASSGPVARAAVLEDAKADVSADGPGAAG